jgi:hypothetical protein
MSRLLPLCGRPCMRAFGGGDCKLTRVIDVVLSCWLKTLDVESSVCSVDAGWGNEMRARERE